jgi:hypothetical protein
MLSFPVNFISLFWLPHSGKSQGSYSLLPPSRWHTAPSSDEAAGAPVLNHELMLWVPAAVPSPQGEEHTRPKECVSPGPMPPLLDNTADTQERGINCTAPKLTVRTHRGHVSWVGHTPWPAGWPNGNTYRQGYLECLADRVEWEEKGVPHGAKGTGRTPHATKALMQNSKEP